MNKKLRGTRASLLGAPGIATRSKDATRGSWPYYQEHSYYYEQKLGARTLLGAPGLTTRRFLTTRNKKLRGPRASLLVGRCIATSKKLLGALLALLITSIMENAGDGSSK